MRWQYVNVLVLYGWNWLPDAYELDFVILSVNKRFVAYCIQSFVSVAKLIPAANSVSVDLTETGFQCKQRNPAAWPYCEDANDQTEHNQYLFHV